MDSYIVIGLGFLALLTLAVALSIAENSNKIKQESEDYL